MYKNFLSKLSTIAINIEQLILSLTKIIIIVNVLFNILCNLMLARFYILSNALPIIYLTCLNNILFLF